MKILQVISSLGIGGAEKFVIELSNELSNNNQVLVCSFKSIEDWMIFPEKLTKSVRLTSFNKKAGYDFKLYLKLISLIIKGKIEVLHFHLDATIKYIFPLIIIFPRVKFIYTIHSNLNADKIKLFKKLYIIKWLSKKVKYVCISESIYYEFKKEFPEFDFVLIENGISKLETSQKLLEIKNEIRKYKANNETKIFLTIGNYSEPKNFSLIVNVFSKFYQTNHNVILLLIGNDSGSEKKEWGKIENLKSPNTFMIGAKSNIQDYLFLSDAYCLCSTFEGLPISILEAYSLGKPVLSTPAGGIPSILKNHINGLLSSDFTIESYYQMIIEFLHFSEEDLEKIKKNNLNDFSNNFSIEKIANKYILNYTN